MTTSFFEKLEAKPADPIFGLNAEYQADPRKDKVNLIIGVCVEEDGSAPHVLEVVKEAEKQLVEKEITKDYLGIDGDATFIQATVRLVLGSALYEQNVDRIYAAQVPGGTAALRTLVEFLQKNFSGEIAISDPTWANHITMANYLGLKISYYPYYDKNQHKTRFKECVDFLNRLSPKTIVLLQAATHNPTGVDFSLEEWKTLANLFKQRELIPLFDIAYQGFGRGLADDVEALQLFVKEGIECFIAYSYSKNFGIYCERVGALIVVANNPAYKAVIASHIKASIRANYSNPPFHGAAVIRMVLNEPKMRKKWEQELHTLAECIRGKRRLLAEAFGKEEYQFLTQARGFFSLLNLTPEQVVRLKKEYGVYVTSAGRINVAGINKNNIERVVSSVLQVTR